MAQDSREARVIDVHCHYVPEACLKALEDAGRADIDVFPLPRWTARGQIEAMDQIGVDLAIMSLSSPDISWGDDETARRLAREANEAAAEAAREYPGRLGFMATLPLPDIDASLAEVDYAFDVLHADGVKLYSNNNGVYLGDCRLEPVFEELGRRRAVVTMHPVKPKEGPGPQDLLPQFRGHPWLDFMVESTRAVANLVMSGVLRRNTGVKFVCPHLGTLFPLLAARMRGTAELMLHYGVAEEGFEVPDVRATLRTLYYDTAGGYDLPVQMPALLSIAAPDRIMFGSDSPFTPPAVVAGMMADLRALDLLSDTEKEAILGGTARGLFPRARD